MKTTKIALIGMLAVAMVACKPAVKTVSGVIEDATMNNVTVIAENGDTLNFSTMNADMTNANGMLLGAPITVVYTQDGMADTVKVCAVYGQLIGQWVEPVPMDSAMMAALATDTTVVLPLMQGINLMVQGEAASINMATLQYQNWALCGNQVVLSGESLGNGQTIAFNDTLDIELITEDSLRLTNGTMTLAYSKQQ